MRLDKKDMVLYAVTDRHWLNGESLYSQVEKALKGGATFIQLREKNLGEEEFLAEAKEIARLCKSYHVPFVICRAHRAHRRALPAHRQRHTV